MRLERIGYLPDATLGRLVIQTQHGIETLATLERPWIPGRAPGGAAAVSSVPDGSYVLQRHSRPNGDVCVALRNPALGVFYSDASIPAGKSGRTLILIHAANYVDELMGCIAPGLARMISENRMMVTSSRAAMEIVMAAFEAGDKNLVISPALGAKD